MPPLPKTRRENADSLKRSADHLDASDDEAARLRPTTRNLKGPPSKQNNPGPPVPQADTSTEAPVSIADSSTVPKSRSYLMEYIAKHITQEREKPVRDEYHEDLKALGEGRKDAQPANAGASDRDSLEEAAKLKLQAGLEAVLPSIVEQVKPYADLLISEYSEKVKGLKLKTRLATIERDNRERPWTRAEAARADEMSLSEQNSSGLPLDHGSDEPESSVTAGEQKEDSDSTAKRADEMSPSEQNSSGLPLDRDSDEPESGVTADEQKEDSDSTAKEDLSTDPSADTPAEK